MRSGLSLLVGAVVCFSFYSALPGQEPVNPQSETPIGSPAKIRFLPPTDVKVSVQHGQTSITWTPINLGRIEGYVVYQKADSATWNKLGTVPKPPFVIESADRTREFSVATLDRSGTEGQKSKPVSAQTEKPSSANSNSTNPKDQGSTVK